VKADLRLAARVLAFPTLALLFVAAAIPGKLGVAARVYSLLLAATVLGVALAALRRSYPPSTPLQLAATRRASARPLPPPTLLRLEQACALGVARSFDLHYRVRPRLREIAAPLLAIRRGVTLDGDRDAARNILGEETWGLVRADRPPPEDRLASGIPVATLREVVESLERL
jgi:hypothetical protein